MNKYKLAAIPLLIATIIMMASSVLPHHHHGVFICFNETHREEQEAGKTCQHNHRSNSCEKECEVKQLFEIDIIKEHHHKCSSYPEWTPDQQFLPLCIIARENNIAQLPGNSRTLSPTPYREHLHPITWSVVSAGRAPPTAIA